MSITGPPPKCWIVPSTDFPQGELVFATDDDRFSHHGDMLSPKELRNLELRDAENIADRATWLAEYVQSGIADDEDGRVRVLAARR